VLQQSEGVLCNAEDGAVAQAEMSGDLALDSPLPTPGAVPRSNGAGRLERLVGFSNQVEAVGLAILDHQCRYVAVNRCLARLNGIAIDAHFGRSIEDVVPDIGPMLARLVAQLLQTNRPLRQVKFSARVPFIDGPVRDWLGSFFPINLASGVGGVAYTVIDVTDCARIEAALSEFLPESVAPINEALTARETEVLTLIGQGKTTKEIAALLSISVQTVGNHRKQLCRKLDLHTTAEIASYAAHHSAELLRRR
jgi:DNA-binding CsgD family transcriptional regulator